MASWVGYEAHLTETCDGDAPHLITKVETSAAPAADGAPIPEIHDLLKVKEEAHDMANQGMIRDATIALASGYLGTRAMDPTTVMLQEMASDSDKRQEKDVSPGVAYDVAARKISEWVGLHLSNDGLKLLSAGLHWSIGLSAGVLYVTLRRRTSLGPIAAGLLSGLVLWAGVDEGLNSLLGFSAPPARYPLGTHIRGVVGHIVLGLVTAGSAETLSNVSQRSRGT